MSNRIASSPSACLAACVLALASLPAAAVDGVVLIDQNRAIAGAVTPGDAAGFPISLNQPGSYRLSGNLTVPAGLNGIEINADGVTLDLNGFAITGPGVFPNGSFAAIAGPDRQRVSVANGTIAGFVFGFNFPGDARFIRLEKLQMDSTTKTSDGRSIVGLAGVVGTNRASYALIDNVQANGQLQITCPGLIRNSAVQAVETRVPPDGSGVVFPTNCKADNYLSGPFN